MITGPVPETACAARFWVGANSYAVLSNGWKPYFAGHNACIMAFDHTGCPDVDTASSGSMGADAGGHTLGSGGDRMSAGSPGPAGGVEREQVRGDAGHGAGPAGSDYQHNADEDFYASDAFDDDRFYGSRRGGSSGASGGMSGSSSDPGGMGEGMGADRDETRRLAREASERLREDERNRGVGRSGNL